MNLRCFSTFVHFVEQALQNLDFVSALIARVRCESKMNHTSAQFFLFSIAQGVAKSEPRNQHYSTVNLMYNVPADKVNCW